MVEVIRFGTDGWRDIIADGFTVENVRRVAQAHAQFLLASGGSSVVVGFDTRFASPRFARAAAEVMAANGLKTFLAKAFTPTPVLSFAVVHLGAAGGVMITASHNPPEYNGYKVKGPYGGSATPEIVASVEAQIQALRPIPDFDAARHSIELFDVRQEYYASLAGVLDMDVLRNKGGLLYHDAMGGAGCGWLEGFAKKFKLAAEVRPVHGVPSPMFYGVNPEPVPQSLESLRAVLGGHSDPVFGSVTDGDADRVGAVLAGGQFFNSHQIFAVLLKRMVGKGLTGRVVKTVSSSQIIDRLCALYGLELLETPVGFKYITDAFLEGEANPAKRVLIGGEESGGLAVQGHIPERDGLLNSLLLLEATLVTGKSLRELFADIEREVDLTHAYDRVDMRLGAGFDKAAMYERLLGFTELAGREVERVVTLDGVKFMLSGGAWVLFRASGTEPLVRVYSEARSTEEVTAILQAATAAVQG